MGYVRQVVFSIGVLAIASMSLAAGCTAMHGGPSSPPPRARARRSAPATATPTDPQAGTVDDTVTMFSCMEMVKGVFACMDDPAFTASVDAKQLDALRPLKGDVAKDSGAASARCG